ncbi:MAG: DNA polymerase III subunit gamma/tau [Candidatus Aminicenantes bacterium]|jgi:DNA polymerase-3 subunit gamma/tau|nr:DNA polymerase III subunit gamma/tau [Candidatus Aminicenantes bacterium]
MSYLIYARKYRPKTFEEMIGQKAVVQTLQNAVKNNRVAQAYLFSGMRGVGKTTAARILAKALNCQHGPTPTPCNKCEFCLSINEDRSIDVLEIDGASNRGVEDISPIRDTGKYKPIHSRFKIIIIDEVHMLSTHAFNALLKTLEEPPPSTVFIFATTEFHKVPATIISRCQHFEFKKVSQKDIINHLMDICKKEGLTISPYGLGLIAEASDGSIRDAQSLLDQAVAFCGENIGDQELKEILGTVSQDLLFEFSSAVFEEKPEAVFSLVEKVIESGHDLRFFFKELVEHFRNLLLIASVENAQDLLAFNPEELTRLKEESQKASPEDFLRCLQALQQAEPGMRYSSHPQIYFEVLLVRLCHFKKIVLLKDILQEIDKIKKEGAVSAESLPRTSWPSPPPIKAQEKPETRPRPSGPVETKTPAAASHTPFDKPKDEPIKQEREMDIALKDPAVKTFMSTFKARVLSVEPIKGKAKEEED